MKRSLFWLSMIAVLLLAPLSQAYITIRSFTNEDIRWDDTDITWSIHTSGMPGMADEDFKSAIAAAFQSWEDVDCSTVTFEEYDAPGSFPPVGFSNSDPGNGIYITVNTNSWDPSVGHALAYAQQTQQTYQSSVIQDVDIVFNAVEVQWSTNLNPGYGYQDVQGVVTHEIGHALGLDHPRHQSSTMFFSGGATELRSLEEDDQRGACFLYPTSTFQDGQPCDACETDSNCDDGYCLQWGSWGNEYWVEPTFCGRDCNSDSDCPSDFYCYGGTNANPLSPKQCIPSNGYCNDAGGTIQNGDYCYGHQTCESGYCLVSPGETYCTQTCTNSCPSGYTCMQGLCVKAGNKAYGALCDESSECQSGMCINFTLSFGACTLPCGANGGTCPNGNQCFFDSVCVPPGTSLNGQPCYTPIQCQGTYCLEGSCTQPCTSNASCPAGTTCVEGYCDGVLSGGQCENQNDCAEGLTCQKDTNSGPGTCHRSCEPLADTGCVEGEVCQWRYEAWAQFITGRCVAKNYGGSEAQSCSASNPCEGNLVCHAGNGTTEVCHRDCQLFKNNLGCNVGQLCETLDDPADPKHGICTPPYGDSSDPEPEPDPPTPDAGSPPTPDTSTPPSPDAGTGPEPDAASPRPQDTTSSTPDAGTTPRADSGTSGIGTAGTDISSRREPGVTEAGTCTVPTFLDPTSCVQNGGIWIPANTNTAGTASDGGGCQSTAPSPLWWWACAALGWLVWRRRGQVA